MMSIGLWRWPVVVTLPLVAGGLLIWRGVVRLPFETAAVLRYSGNPKDIPSELRRFRSEAARRDLRVTFEMTPGRIPEIRVRAEASSPGQAVERANTAARLGVERSLTIRRDALDRDIAFLKKQKSTQEALLARINQDRTARFSGSRRQAQPDPRAAEKIAQLKARRQFLINRYPSHTDIQLLAKQIEGLQTPRRSSPSMSSEERTDSARKLNEALLRINYFSRRLHDLAQRQQDLTSGWIVKSPAPTPKRPARVEGGRIGAGTMLGLFVVGIVVIKGKRKSTSSTDGLWKPETPTTPVELSVVPAEPATDTTSASSALPSDPLTEKAAALYRQWMELTRKLYEPSAQAPQGVLDQVGPLLQASGDFLPEGHDVLARYLAQTVTPGDLPAHVARTVLMTLTGAQEAGVSPEHRLALALAALFHDLAVVPRPAASQDDVGSEVGRLSASVLRKIPGLPPALLSMVEDILIGMDEFKLETWQNVANGQNLEPLSKVLREIDRFEKVMQKQRARLDRQLTRKTA